MEILLGQQGEYYGGFTRHESFIRSHSLTPAKSTHCYSRKNGQAKHPLKMYVAKLHDKFSSI